MPGCTKTKELGIIRRVFGTSGTSGMYLELNPVAGFSLFSLNGHLCPRTPRPSERGALYESMDWWKCPYVAAAFA